MKMNKFAVIALIIALVAGGCSADKVSAPTATAAVGSAANVQVTLSSGAIASGGNVTVTATVTDNTSLVVPNATVSFSVISSTYGTFSPTSATTDASGNAVSTFTAGSSVNANATIMATVTVGTSQISGSAQLTIGTPPRTPTSVTVTLNPTSIAPSGSTTVSATVSDATGGISGQSVTFSLSDSAAGNLSATSATTNASGLATVTFTANAVNQYVEITATAGTLSNSAMLQIGTPPPPVAASIAISIDQLSISIGSYATVSVLLLDSSNNPAFGSSVTLQITSGPSDASFAPISQPTLTSITVTTNSSGIATAILYAGDISGTVVVSATDGSLLPVTASLPITSDPARISLTITNSSLTSGQTTNITAQVLNAANAPVSEGTAVTFTLSGTAGSISPTVAYTDQNGNASVTFTASQSVIGTVAVVASAGSKNSPTATISVSAAQAGSIIFVSATPDIINIKGAGTSDSTVTFRVISSTGSPLSGVSVNFTLYGPTGATLDVGGLTTSSGSTDANGEVTTLLHAGSVAGPARIAATVPNPGLSTSSGNISIGGGVPSDRWFSVSANRYNIDGLGCNGAESTISAYLADRFGNYNILQGTSVSFATDAGAIDTSNVTDATGLTSAVYRTQNPRPTDVAPAAWESTNNLFYTSGSVTHNPRDGWFSIVVSTTGEEHFQDDNANGVYDLGETFVDLDEPYLDSDDNGSRGTGELFFDWPSYVVPNASSGHAANPNGVYDNANGIWDAKIPIYRIMTLAMTGPPHSGPYTSRIESATTGTNSISIPRGSSATFYVYVSDINMNAPIGGTVISLKADDSSAVITALSGETILDQLPAGPAVIAYRIKNNLAATASSVVPNITAEISWPGTCAGTQKYTLSFEGTVTLQ